jgi:hypothetical protein
MHVRMQGNMQYVFHDVCHIQIITYFYGWCTVLETLGSWCLLDKKLVVPREKLERQRLKMLFFSPLMTTVEEVYLKHDQLHSYSLRFYMAVSILNFTCNQMFPFDGHLLATSTQQTTKLQIMNLTLTSRSMTSFLCYYCY